MSLGAPHKFSKLNAPFSLTKAALLLSTALVGAPFVGSAPALAACSSPIFNPPTLEVSSCSGNETIAQVGFNNNFTAQWDVNFVNGATLIVPGDTALSLTTCSRAASPTSMCRLPTMSSLAGPDLTVSITMEQGQAPQTSRSTAPLSAVIMRLIW